MNRESLTHKELLEHLSYNEDTGEFIRKISSKSQKKGDIAGGFDGLGYGQLSINGTRYKTHRLAWFYVNGVWPYFIDHINQNQRDNRICNLRDVSHVGNSRNLGLSKNNKSGVCGVHWCKKYKQWAASINMNKTKKSLGRFDNFNDAVIARKIAEYEIGYHPNHGKKPEEIMR